jgi:parvulin-like peptidyl-prolyl isomerase
MRPWRFIFVMRQLRLLIPLAFVALLVAACGGGGGGGGKVPAGDVAVVDGQSISRSQFDGLLEQARRSYKAQKRTFPKAGSTEYQALQTQAVQFLVQRQEFAQKAKGLGINVSDKQVADRLDQIKKQYFGSSEKRYQQQLKAQGLTDQEVREDIRSQLVSEQIFNKVTAKISVSDKEIQDYYNTHKSQYGQPETRAVRHILVKSKALATQIYVHLRADNGSDFAQYAKKYSQDPGSKAKGGDLGTISKGQTVPPFDQAAFTLPTKSISTPIKTQFGYHIIQPLSAVHPAQTTPLKTVKESIRAQLLQQKKNTVMTKWVDDTKKSYCGDHKLRYAPGFTPSPDPCATKTSSTTTT